MPVSILKDKQTNAWFFLKRQSEAKEHFRQLIQKGCFLKNEKLLLSFVVRKSETRNRISPVTFWDLFTGRQLGGDCSSLTLPSDADKKVKVPMSGIAGFQG